ncbi:MAG: hypothetical protein QOG99_3854 [Frankiales bacterium]|jgi:hypothetical protein|nr:hypothetical protein [Frankiales bacterium]
MVLPLVRDNPLTPGRPEALAADPEPRKSSRSRGIGWPEVSGGRWRVLGGFTSSANDPGTGSVGQ